MEKNVDVLENEELKSVQLWLHLFFTYSLTVYSTGSWWQWVEKK